MADLPQSVTIPEPQATPARMVGRDGVLDRITDAATSPYRPPLLIVTGPAGIGRSAVLTAAQQRLAVRGVATVTFRVARTEQSRPYAVAARLAAELDSLPGGAGRGGGRGSGTGRGSGAGRPAVGPPAASAPETQVVTANRLAGVLAAAVHSRRPLVVFIDDLQWADPGSLGTLAPLVRALAGSLITVVAAFRFPVAGAAPALAALGELRGAGLAEVVALRPLARSEVDALLTDMLQAKPSEEFSALVCRQSRGIPTAVLAATAGYRRTGALRVVDRNAYLVFPDQPPELATDLSLLAHLRELGPEIWSVAKAVAVLWPLGDAAPALIAEATDADPDTVRAALDRLRADGVLRPGPNPGHWRFRLPLLVIALGTQLGPYERRRLSQVAVTALWAGAASTTDSRYLPEQLVTAGKLIDPARASGELLGQGVGVLLTNGYFAERWLRAALGLITDAQQRAWTLLLHASACCVHLRFADAVASAWLALSEKPDLLPPDMLVDLEVIYVMSLSGTLDRESLTAVVDDGWRTLPGGEGHRAVTRLAALCMLDRWPEAAEFGEATRHIWSADSAAVAEFGYCFTAPAAAFIGKPAEYDALVTDPTRFPMWDDERHRFEQLSGLTRIIMGFGDLNRADDLLARHPLPVAHWKAPDHVVHLAMRGEWDQALHLARVSLASGSSLGCGPAHTFMLREISIILTARGQLTLARTMLRTGRADQPVLTHMFHAPESEVELVLGTPDRATKLLLDGLALAEERGVLIGVDELWLRLIKRQLADGEVIQARESVARLAEVAERLGTERAGLFHLIGQATAFGDQAAADEAVALARKRSQPYELAMTLMAAAGMGPAESRLLREAYDLFGQLDALLPRARMRNVMRENDVPVPRDGTVAENERLLAALVTEGLTNKELASVLQTSEKSIEGRLTRFFQRTGYRSRVELAAAMLTGEYPG